MPETPIPSGLTLEKVYDFVNDEFACGHDEAGLTIKTASNGTRHFRRQCRRCGKSIEAVQTKAIPADEQGDIPAFDEGLAREWYHRIDERRREVREHIAARDRDDWFGRYDEYLDSPAWRERRRKVLDRDNRICQGCLVAPASEVHHLTYDHVGNELLHELVSLCGPCHRRAHETAKAI